MNESAFELNHKLLNLRKQGDLTGRLRSKRTIIRDQSEYRFAVEVSIRFLERRDEVTLDKILCDPWRAREFDGLCSQISPGHEPLKYRWAALGLRKASKVSPEILARVIPSTSVSNHLVSELNVNELPTSQGVYLFYEPKSLLYVGEAINLKKRLKKHLDHSDNKGLARWLWDNGPESLHLEVQVLPKETKAKHRKALELEIIRSRSPVFNVIR